MQRRRITKIFIGAVGGLVAFAVLINVAPLLIPWERLEAKLSNDIEAAIGRKLIIAGTASS